MSISNYVIICFRSFVPFFSGFIFGGIGFYVIQRNSQPTILVWQRVFVDSQTTRSSNEIVFYFFTIAHLSRIVFFSCSCTIWAGIIGCLLSSIWLKAISTKIYTKIMLVYVVYYTENTQRYHSNWRRNKFMAHHRIYITCNSYKFQPNIFHSFKFIMCTGVFFGLVFSCVVIVVVDVAKLIPLIWRGSDA